LAIDADQHGLGLALQQALGRQDMLHLGGADAEGQGPKGAMGRGVGVAADDGHARLGEALLRPHDVDDALAGITHAELGDTELDAVAAQGLHLEARDGIDDALVAIRGGDIVIGHRQIGRNPPGLAPGQAQPGEGLGRGDLMDQLAVDVEERRAILVVADEVLVPQFVIKGLGSHEGRPPNITDRNEKE
jgi:hypothetical protein